MTPPVPATMRVAALALALAIAGCGQGPQDRPKSAGSVVSNPSAETDAILLLLDQGEVGNAKKRIAAALKRDPMNASLQVLRDSIERDPKELLGTTSYPYTTREGDTMSGLAKRFLGNRLKAYQLSRYNGIARPASLTAGQTMRIPGEPPQPEPSKRPERHPVPAATATMKPKPGLPSPRRRRLGPILHWRARRGRRGWQRSIRATSRARSG